MERTKYGAWALIVANMLAAIGVGVLMGLDKLAVLFGILAVVLYVVGVFFAALGLYLRMPNPDAPRKWVMVATIPSLVASFIGGSLIILTYYVSM